MALEVSQDPTNDSYADQQEGTSENTFGVDNETGSIGNSGNTSSSSTPVSSRHSSSSGPIATSMPLHKKNKRRRTSNNEEPSQYQLQLLTCLKSVAEQSSPAPSQIDDEYENFGKSVAQQIRKLPTALARATAKKHIQDVLFNIECSSAQELQPIYHDLG